MKPIFRKMRALQIFAITVVTSLSLVSCGGGGGSNPAPGPGPTPDASTLSVSPTTLTLAANASATVTVTSNVAWTVSAPTGYTASPTSGSNNGSFTVTAGATPTGGTLTVSGKGKSASVTISAPSAAAITVSPESIEIENASGKTGTFTITCSGSWEITLPTSKPTWLTSVAPLSGTGNATVTVTTGEYTSKNADQTFVTVKSGTNTKYVTIKKAGAQNVPPTKPTNLQPTGSNISTITTFSWAASTDANGDAITYTAMVSKDNSTWTTIATTKNTSAMNKTELDKNTTYYYKVVADDGYDGGKTESDVVTFTTGSTKDYWADGEYKLYEVGPDGTPTEVTSTTRKFKLIYTGDGYTQDLFKYGGQFDQEVQKGIKALFQIEPYKHYYSYFAIYVVAAYSNEAGMSQGSTDWNNATTKVDTKFKCSWQGGNSTGIGCDKNVVIEYAQKIPEMSTMAALTYSPTSIVINADVYAGTNIWSYNGAWGGMGVLSIAQTPARHPATSSYGGFEYTLRHEFGGHGIGLLGDEYVYYNTTPFPQSNESNFRQWQSFGCYPNTYLPTWDSSTSAWSSPEWEKTPEIHGQNWKTFYSRPEYTATGINFFAGSAMYGVGVYRSESRSCMIDNITHYNTVSRWKIYCRIKITAGETPDLEEFITNDVEKVNPYTSSSGAYTKAAPPARRCEGPLLEDPWHKKPYRLK
ncbi:MAG: hypothetical protein J6Z32_05105 [Bacteroidales bacterium]|nr:hypothetical protein [Bacteroidales bacterium]